MSTVKRWQSDICQPSRSDNLQEISLQKCVFSTASINFDESSSSRLDTATTTEVYKYVSGALNMLVQKDKHQPRKHMSYVSKHISDVCTARAPLNSRLKADLAYV